MICSPLVFLKQYYYHGVCVKTFNFYLAIQNEYYCQVRISQKLIIFVSNMKFFCECIGNGRHTTALRIDPLPTRLSLSPKDGRRSR